MLVWALIAWAVNIYLLVLVGRVIISWVEFVSPAARISGWMAVVAEVVFTLTDPPLRLLARVLPPLRIGPVSVDLGVLVLFVVLSMVGGLASALAAGGVAA